jgi:hypothetical protein
MLAIIIAVVVVGVITGLFCMATKESTDDSDWAYEYETDIKPDCFRRSQSKRGSCDGAYNVQDFTLHDCATCKYWRGKLNR